MNRDDDSIPLLPPMSEEEIEAFYRRERKRPLSAEELAFFRNPIDTVPMDDVIAELDEIIKNRQEAGTLP